MKYLDHLQAAQKAAREIVEEAQASSDREIRQNMRADFWKQWFFVLLASIAATLALSWLLS